MNIISSIISRLKKYPQLSYEVNGNTISVNTSLPSGFTVWITDHNSGFTVGYDGWHEEFKSEEAALNCFAFGFSSGCRLKVIKRGNAACSWTLESKEGNEWIEDSKTGNVFIPFWKSKTVEYLSNPIIK